MTTIEAHQTQLKHAILDVLTIGAVFAYAMSLSQIHEYLALSIAPLPLQRALEQLEADKVVIKIGEFYGIPQVDYPNPHSQRTHQAELLRKAGKWARWFRLLPFVKSVVVVNSAALGNVTSKSDIDLMIITSPARIYITKGTLMYSLKILHQLETADKKAGQFSLGMFLTTGGVNFKKDMMKSPDPYLDYWLIFARPLYRADVYYDLLRTHTKLTGRFPNYPMTPARYHIYGRGSRLLDWLDGVGYRRHLKHTAAQTKNHTELAFVRVRPDIINLHALDGSTKIYSDYKRLRSFFRS